MGNEKKYTKTERRGLPGGPNEMFTYVTGVFSSSPGFYKAESSIEGQGLFADKTFSPGDLIGLAHEDGVPVTELGKFHNHNENDPNMSSRLIGNQRYVFANKDIKPGDELTTNYRLQPELEQPEDFLAKAQDGNGENIVRSNGEDQDKSLLQELTEGVGSFYKELVAQKAQQKEAVQRIDTSGYGIRVIQYPYGHRNMESSHIEAVLYDKDTDEIVNKIPGSDFIGYINRWPGDGNREVKEYKYKDDESVRVVDLALPDNSVKDFIIDAQEFLPSKRDKVHTNLGISNKNELPISGGSNPRRYDFLESNCATGICIGLGMDPDSPVNQTGGITDPNEVMDNILTTFSNYVTNKSGERTSRREGITKLVTEELGIKPNSRVLSIAVDYLDGLGRGELTDALEDLSKKPIVQRLAKGESFMSPLGVAQTASEISDAFGELPDGTMSALLGMAWEQGPNAYIRENTPFDFSSEGVDNIIPWWQRNVISPVGDALEDAGKSVSNFFGFQEGGGIYNIGKQYNPLLSHGGEEGHSPKSIIEVDKDVKIPYDKSLQHKFKPKLDKTKFSINTDFKKKFGTKFHTVLPTDTQIDFKTTLPLNIFSSVLPFDLPDYNKSKIDLSLKQPINDDTSIGFDINAAIKDGKTQITPQLTFKHSFKKGGSVSWMWKGKKYYGTLIPSMEDEKNRYARTKNGKIKKLPKKQNGGTFSNVLDGLSFLSMPVAGALPQLYNNLTEDASDIPSPNIGERTVIPKDAIAKVNIDGYLDASEEEKVKIEDKMRARELALNKMNLDAAVNFASKWMSSPRYKEMLANSGGLSFLGSASEVQEGRINNLKQIQKDVKYIKDDPDVSYTEDELEGIGGYSRSSDGNIYVHPNTGSLSSTIYDHEISHSIDRPDYNTFMDKVAGGINYVFDTDLVVDPEKRKRFIPSADIELIGNLVDKSIPIPKDKTVSFWSKYGDTPEEGTRNYFAKPTEVRARLNEIRRELSNRGVDIFNNKVTPSDLNKVLNVKPVKGLQNIYPNEAIIQMLNEISMEDAGSESMLNLAQEGGPMSRAERIYNLIPPTGYNDISNIFNYFKVDSDSPVPIRTEMTDPRGEEMYKQYLGINTTPKYLRPSSSKPSISKDENVQYYQLDPELEKSIFGAVGNTLKVGDIKQMGELDLPERFNVDDNYGGYNMWSGLGNFTVSKGVDDEGKEYISYYDKYDLPDYIQDRLKGQPYEVYGRINPNMVREFQGSEIQDEKDYDALYGKGAYREQFLEKVNPQHLVSGTTDVLNKQRLFREDMKKGLSLKKSQRGGTVSELWEEVTGTPWSQAKAQGLTDGGYDANIQLRNQLIQSPSKFKQRPSNTLPPANTNSNAANATLSPEEINDKINRAKDFNSAFGIARDYYGANKIFEYNGKQFGTNLAGETFEPTEEDMIAAGLKREQREKINQQNRLVVSPYTNTDIVEFDEYEDIDKVKQNTEDLNKMSQADLIISYQLTHAENPYVIVDKKKGLMHIYEPGSTDPVYSAAVDLGAAVGSDEQTVTKYFDLDGDGITSQAEMLPYNVDWRAGNMSTGAGRFKISNIDRKGYKGEPLFNMMNEAQWEKFQKTGVKEQVSTSFHNGFVRDDNARVSNGCIRCNKASLDKLTQYLQNTSDVFILPERDENRFVYENGKLNFRGRTNAPRNEKGEYINPETNEVSNVPYYTDSRGDLQTGQGMNRTVNTLNYKPIKIDIDKETFENDIFQPFDFDDEEEYNTVVVPFVKSLEDNKQKIMKTMQVTGDVYNDIAKISLGILGNETNFGDTHSELGNIFRGASKVMNEARSSSPDYQFKYQPSIQLGNEKVPITGGLVPERFTGAKDDDNSVGLTQFRWKWVEKDPELKKRLKTLGITSNVDFMDAEKAALGTAAVLAYYYNNRKVDDIYRDLPKHWAGSIKRDPDRKVYSDNVMKNIKYFTVKEKQFQKGGGIDPDVLLRQAYAESTFRPKVTSSANAKGLTQIRPNVLSDYIKANDIEGDVDLTNVSNAVDVQKWYMDDLYNASFIDKENQTDEVRIAKTLAAYNWGRGNLVDFLNEKKVDLDIYKSLDWVDKLPKETKDYVNKILGNNEQFNKDYNAAIENEKYTYIVNEYKSIGGEISDLKIYKDYVNGLYDGKPNLKKAERIYDKLNRVYYYKAGQVGMSAPNYIMSYLD